MLTKRLLNWKSFLWLTVVSRERIRQIECRDFEKVTKRVKELRVDRVQGMFSKEECPVPRILSGLLCLV